ncbi:hypothetical protein LCGC14_2589040 [marine sediment metagenome]|uniref:Uncharacterized protein n=1 Tax=marine sediment metagenome TaxID=412755 RepID=A0A0F9ACH4_9ZZZZ
MELTVEQIKAYILQAQSDIQTQAFSYPVKSKNRLIAQTEADLLSRLFAMIVLVQEGDHKETKSLLNYMAPTSTLFEQFNP